MLPRQRIFSRDKGVFWGGFLQQLPLGVRRRLICLQGKGLKYLITA